MRSEEIPFSRLRLSSGLELLDQWADGAGQAAKNVMYKALFAILEGSVFRSYDIVDHEARPGEFTVMVRDDLVVRVRVHDADTTFGIDFIGRVDGATA
jgi:uncharacterized protein DUF6235